MPLKYKKGNLFDYYSDIICHGVNCSGKAFGAGVAGQVAKIYPEAKRAYLSKNWELGDVQFVAINERPGQNRKQGRVYEIEDGEVAPLWIANMATQKYYGGIAVHVNYSACYECFEKVFKFAHVNSLSVAMPKVGAGLAGGEWALIEEQLIFALRENDVDLTVYYL